MGRIGDPVTQAAVLFHIVRDVVAGLPGPLADSGRRVGADAGLGAAGQVGSPASNAATVILNLDLDALDGVADGLNPFLHVLADHDFLSHPSRLTNDRFLRLFLDLYGAVLEGIRRQVIGRPIRWPPLDVDVFFPQRDLLLDRRFADIGADRTPPRSTARF